MNKIIASSKALSHKDYGAIYEKGHTTFRVWSPSSFALKLAIYEEWNDFYRQEYEMSPVGDGTWFLDLEGDQEGKYYNFLVVMEEGSPTLEVLDPYAKASAPNARKGMVVDLSKTDPEGFRDFLELPLIHPLKSIIYELHIRDFTVSSNSGVKNSGKYLGLTETGTTHNGFKTGLDHLEELGITHVHIMPVSDFVTVDELNPVDYNWGYDPVQYNVPEGSYATEPTGIQRITEFKKMVHKMHEKGLRVVLDVVYNHTYYTETSNFNRLAPFYFYRTRGGQFTDGSGCGNEMNCSKPMAQKFLLDSLKYWMDEYRVDGFRFDLMGLYDHETIDMVCKELRKTNPTFLIYGEPWVGGHSGLQTKKMFVKGSQRGKYIAVFNDDFRDAVKGDNDGYGKGLISGNGMAMNAIKRGIAGEIAYNKNLIGYADEPIEVVNYICAHDNLILRDKIEKVSEGSSEDYRLKMNRLAFTLMLMSFGTPFIHEGTEFYRTKYHDHNSFKSPDHVNQVDWKLKEEYYQFYKYIESLIDFRQRTGIFNQTADEIRKSLKFQNFDGLGYSIMHEKNTYCFYHNFYDVPVRRQIPKNALVYFLNDFYDQKGSLYPQRAMVDVEGKSSLIYSVVGHCDKESAE